MGFKKWFNELMIRIGINKTKRKSPILKELIDNPENVKLEAYLEGDELIVKIKRKEET